ncbi:hypothetical protein ACNAW0_01030 [Micromonospora sp. SL1-18]|uniref:hypothetical protein n=1 Tax=Micromonospora sp. SL1-18 TaxID=3399128 RepID=UPI003A4DBDBF
MRMATFAVHCPDRLRSAGEEVLRDLVWAHIRQQDRVEHVRVRAGPEHISVALFVLTKNQLDADEVARAVGHRIRALPAFYR